MKQKQLFSNVRVRAFSCKVELFKVFVAACKRNIGKLPIVGKTTVSTRGAQCSELPCELFLLKSDFFFSSQDKGMTCLALSSELANAVFWFLN